MKNGRNGSLSASGRAGDVGLQPAAADRVELQPEPLGVRVEIVDEDRVRAQRLAGQHVEQHPSDRRRRGLLGVVDRHQLEVAAAERDDPVARALAFVVAAGVDGEAEFGLDPRLRGVEVAGAVDHVVEAHCPIQANPGVRFS